MGLKSNSKMISNISNSINEMNEVNSEELIINFCNDMVTNAKDFSPVDTGENRDKIGTEPRILQVPIMEAKVIARAKHASFLEFGTYKMDPQPFMTPAFNKTRNDYGV